MKRLIWKGFNYRTSPRTPPAFACGVLISKKAVLERKLK